MASFVDDKDKKAFLREKSVFKSTVESCFLKYAEMNENASHETRRTSRESVTLLTVSGTRKEYYMCYNKSIECASLSLSKNY